MASKTIFIEGEDAPFEFNNLEEVTAWLVREGIKYLVSVKTGKVIPGFVGLENNGKYKRGPPIAPPPPPPAPAEFKVARLPRWEVKLSDSLATILSRPVPPCISYFYLTHFGVSSIGVPPAYATENYDFAPALLRLVAQIVRVSPQRGEGTLTHISSALHEFCVDFGAPLDNSLVVNLATPASSGSAARSKREEGASKKEYRASRPDGSFLVASIPVCEIEDKPSAEAASCDPYQQLEMCLWLPHHSNLTWRLGIVKDYGWMSFVPLRKVQDGESFKTQVVRGEEVKVPMGREVWEHLGTLVNVAALIWALAQQTHSFPNAQGWLQKMRQQQERTTEAQKTVRVWVYPDHVHKYYEEASVVARLKSFYKDTSEVEGLEHLAQKKNLRCSGACVDAFCLLHDQLLPGKFRSFVLNPVGIPADCWRQFDPAQCEVLEDQLTSTLHALHATGWVHLDIRPSNVVLWEPLTPHQRWFLVDSEYAQRIGQPVPKKRYTEAYEGKPAAPEHDFAQLAAMLQKLCPRKRARGSDQKTQ